MVQHSYEDSNGCDETKFVGIFATEKDAKEAIAVSAKLEGFSDHPDDFYCSKVEVGKREWRDGFAGKNVIWPPEDDI